MKPSDAGLRLEGIWKSYGARAVLRGVDLSVEPGEVYGLVGTNGSGKSTTLHIVAGVVEADRGHVLQGGVRLSNAVRARLGFAPQVPALYPRLTCVETLRFFAGVYGVRRRDQRSLVEAAIRSAGLERYRGVRAQALSGGSRQRLNLASAIVHEPDLLVLDEPTTGLDVEVRSAVWRLMETLTDRGIAVLLASHSFQEVETHCHRVGVLTSGCIAAEGSPEELRRLVPAAEVAELEVDDATALLAKGRVSGWDVRRRGERWHLLLRTPTTLPDLARELDFLPLRSLSLRRVNLEDAFLEVMGNGGWDSGFGSGGGGV